jgi:hypothetical protein
MARHPCVAGPVSSPDGADGRMTRHFFFPLRLCGRPHCLVGGNLFPAVGIHVVNVKGSIGAVEEQSRARAAGVVYVMTGQRGVCAGREPEGRTVLHRQSPSPADDQQSLVRRVPVPWDSAA